MIRRLRSLPTKTFYNENAKYWQGNIVKPVFEPEESIGSMAIKYLLKDPEHIAQVNKNNKQ